MTIQPQTQNVSRARQGLAPGNRPASANVLSHGGSLQHGQISAVVHPVRSLLAVSSSGSNRLSIGVVAASAVPNHRGGGARSARSHFPGNHTSIPFVSGAVSHLSSTKRFPFSFQREQKCDLGAFLGSGETCFCFVCVHRIPDQVCTKIVPAHS